MPELHFSLRWPDGSAESYYSPSTIVREHMTAGASYPLPEFLDRVRDALHRASDRVLAVYGHRCSSAMDTLSRIEETAARFEQEATASVEVVRLGD